MGIKSEKFSTSQASDCVDNWQQGPTATPQDLSLAIPFIFLGIIPDFEGTSGNQTGEGGKGR